MAVVPGQHIRCLVIMIVRKAKKSKQVSLSTYHASPVMSKPLKKVDEVKNDESVADQHYFVSQIKMNSYPNRCDIITALSRATLLDVVLVRVLWRRNSPKEII